MPISTGRGVAAFTRPGRNKLAFAFYASVDGWTVPQIREYRNALNADGFHTRFVNANMIHDLLMVEDDDE